MCVRKIRLPSIVDKPASKVREKGIIISLKFMDYYINKNFLYRYISLYICCFQYFFMKGKVNVERRNPMLGITAFNQGSFTPITHIYIPIDK